MEPAVVQRATSQNGIAMLACDVTSDESVASVIAEVLRRSGRIDVLVNNAGFGLIAGAEESSIEQAKSLFEVNVFGAMRMTNHVLPADAPATQWTCDQYQFRSGLCPRSRTMPSTVRRNMPSTGIPRP